MRTVLRCAPTVAAPVTLADMLLRAVANGDTYTRIGTAVGVSKAAVQRWATQQGVPEPRYVEPLARELRQPAAEVARARLEARLDQELARHEREVAKIRREFEQLG